MAAQTSTSADCVDRLSLPPELSFLAPTVIGDLIRIGRENDGGYVVPSSSVMAADFLISFGISDDWSFEEHFKTLNPEAQIHVYDHTVSASHFRASVMRGLLKFPFGQVPFDNLAQRFALHSSYRRFFKGDVRHFKERIICEPTRAFDTTPTTAFQRAGSNKLFVKIDIEGYEYGIIEDLVSHAKSITAMAIEFHNTSNIRSQFVASIDSLRKVYDIVHLHANNFGSIGHDGLPDALELTFVRKSRHASNNKRLHLPLPIVDSPNNPRKSDYRINFP